jgi:hypothetical protein
VRPTLSEVTRRLGELYPSLTLLAQKGPVQTLAAHSAELVVVGDVLHLAAAPAGFPGFVDPTSKTDLFPSEAWADLAQFFVEWMRSAAAKEPPRGRYSMAKSIQESGAVFAESYTLGELCHLVQLAIGKGLLVHEGNTLKPVAASHEHAKGLLDATGRAPRVPERAASDLRPVETWDDLRAAVRLVLRKGPEGFPLAEFHRQLAAIARVEVLPRMLGHAKVSTMLTDPEMRATCAVYIDETCSDMTVVYLPPSVRPPRAGLQPFEQRASAQTGPGAASIPYAVEAELVTFLFLRSQTRAGA